MIRLNHFHRPAGVRGTVARFLVGTLCAGSLAVGMGGPLSSVGQAHAATLTLTCGLINAYTAPTATTAGTLTITGTGSTTSTTANINVGAAFTGIPVVVGDTECVNPTLDTYGNITGASVTGSITAAANGVLVGPFVFAHANLYDASGNYAGIAALTQDTGTGLTYVSVTLFDPALASGTYAVSFGSVGSCAGSAFASSGTTVSTLPNISVNASGFGDLEAVSTQFSLNGVAPTLLDTDGSAILVSTVPATGTTGTGTNTLCGVVTAI